MTVSDSVVIEASPEEIYAELSDPTQMARWSPENRGAKVADGPGRAPYVGMTFVGDNKRGPARWVTRCTVTAAEPGRRFAFDVDRYGLGVPLLPVRIATWAYDLEPVAGGTRVTETWTDRRRGWPDAVADRFDRFATGGRTFAEFQRGNIARTLARLKADFESR